MPMAGELLMMTGANCPHLVTHPYLRYTVKWLSYDESMMTTDLLQIAVTVLGTSVVAIFGTVTLIGKRLDDLRASQQETNNRLGRVESLLMGQAYEPTRRRS